MEVEEEGPAAQALSTSGTHPWQRTCLSHGYSTPPRSSSSALSKQHPQAKRDNALQPTKLTTSPSNLDIKLHVLATLMVPEMFYCVCELDSCTLPPVLQDVVLLSKRNQECT